MKMTISTMLAGKYLIRFIRKLLSIKNKLATLISSCNNDTDEEKNKNFTVTHWDSLPRDIMEVIMGRLNLCDTVRLKSVCKSWRSWLLESRVLKYPLLMLPHGPNCEDLGCYCVSDGSFNKLKLPKSLQGGWCCGSSKNWLFIVKEKRCKYFSREAYIFLFNPDSGQVVQLPPLSAIPYFHRWVKKAPHTFNVSSFVQKIDISSSDLGNCIVAVSFMRKNDDFLLAFCKPGQEHWSILSDKNYDEWDWDWSFLSDFSFVDGELCIGVVSTKGADVICSTFELVDGHQVSLRIIRFWNFGYEEEEGILDVLEDWEDPSLDFVFGSNIFGGFYVVQSADGELLFIGVCFDAFYSDLDYININRAFGSGKISKIDVFKVDVSTGKCGELTSLGNQVMFLQESAPFVLALTPSLGAQLQPNCIYFAMNYYYYKEGQNKDYIPLISGEAGICNLDDGRIYRCFPSIPFYSKLAWLTVETHSL